MVMGDLPTECEVLIIGGGPGGYAAAFHAADLGLDVTLASDEERLGGVCLLRGCIPSKALLNVNKLIREAAEAEGMGVTFGEPDIHLDKLREWKNGVIDELTEGLARLCEHRRVRLAQGKVRFVSADSVRLDGRHSGTIKFKQAIIATGSKPMGLPGIDLDHDRVMNSTAALDVADIPETLLVIGGGYVGLELGQVYASLGSRVTLVEMADRFLPNADADLTKPLARQLGESFAQIHLETKVTGLDAKEDGLCVTLDTGSKQDEVMCDRILIGVGRHPNTDDLGLEKTGVGTDEDGFIVIDEQRRTAERHIYAIGDAAGGLLLAHEAMHEGRVAAEVIAGKPAAFDPRAIPAIVYTDPQIAWCGLTEQQAAEDGRNIKVARFPWQASGRAKSVGLTTGLTKLVMDENGRILGMAAVGRGAEDLVAEGVLAVEMGATAEDLALTIHAHPTLSETVGEAAQAFFGQATHLAPKARSSD